MSENNKLKVTASVRDSGLANVTIREGNRVGAMLILNKTEAQHLVDELQILLDKWDDLHYPGR